MCTAITLTALASLTSERNSALTTAAATGWGPNTRLQPSPWAIHVYDGVLDAGSDDTGPLLLRAARAAASYVHENGFVTDAAIRGETWSRTTPLAATHWRSFEAPALESLRQRVAADLGRGSDADASVGAFGAPGSAALFSPRFALEAVALRVVSLLPAAAVAASEGVEWWVRSVDADTDINGHWDKDEALWLDSSLGVGGQGSGTVRHPSYATVTYLGDIGGPTVVWDIMANHTASIGPFDVGVGSTRGAVVHPRAGSTLVFPGDRFHAVVGSLAVSMVDEPAAGRTLDTVHPRRKRRSRSGVTSRSSSRSGSKQQRVTLLVNLWASRPQSRMSEGPAHSERGGSTPVEVADGVPSNMVLFNDEFRDSWAALTAHHEQTSLVTASTGRRGLAMTHEGRPANASEGIVASHGQWQRIPGSGTGDSSDVTVSSVAAAAALGTPAERPLTPLTVLPAADEAAGEDGGGEPMTWFHAGAPHCLSFHQRLPAGSGGAHTRRSGDSSAVTWSRGALVTAASVFDSDCGWLDRADSAPLRDHEHRCIVTVADANQAMDVARRVAQAALKMTSAPQRCDFVTVHGVADSVRKHHERAAAEALVALDTSAARATLMCATPCDGEGAVGNARRTGPCVGAVRWTWEPIGPGGSGEASPLGTLGAEAVAALSRLVPR